MTSPNQGDFPPPETSAERAAAKAKAAVEELVRANVSSNNTMVRLVEEVRRDADGTAYKVALLQRTIKQNNRTLWMVMVALVALTALAVANFVNLTDARRNAAITASIAADTQDTYDLLLDCLNSQAECGKRNTQAQKKVLDEIKKYELTTLYCARTNPLPEDPKGDAFLACVKRLYPGGPELNAR